MACFFAAEPRWRAAECEQERQIKVHTHFVIKIKLRSPFYGCQQHSLMLSCPQNCCLSLSGDQPLNHDNPMVIPSQRVLSAESKSNIDSAQPPTCHREPDH